MGPLNIIFMDCPFNAVSLTVSTLTHLLGTLLLNRGGGLWGLVNPGGGGQVSAGQRQAERLLLEVDLSGMGFVSDGCFCWSQTDCRA